ncbi:MAG: hydrogenase maturation protease [Nitrosomonas sp.]|nr:hydrogenase maturation protease [Nitrosomonas sp.]MDP1950460.1 hydrogenase maturation protease [Nitrosomonas sp.]
MRARLLLFGYGNPGRGDDALGPLFIEQMSQLNLPQVVCQNDMQLQIEHVTDLAECDQVLFIDADASCPEPFDFSMLTAEKDRSYTSHAVTPAALLHGYHQVYGSHAPPAFLLRIRGYHFVLGDSLSAQAAINLAAAILPIRQMCVRGKLENL